MKVLVSKRAAAMYAGAIQGRQIPYRPYTEKLGIIQGTTVEVRTDHLFKNSFNVVMPDGTLLDLPERFVDRVISDARAGQMKCSFCGNQQKIQKNCVQQCDKCHSDEHMSPLFSNKKQKNVT